MKKFFIAAIMLLAVSVNCAYAQSVKREGNTFKKEGTVRTKSEPKVTPFTYEDSKGNKYPIYIGGTGSCFIIKVSQKTGKEYRQYLGEEVSKQICKDMGINYQPKNKK